MVLSGSIIHAAHRLKALSKANKRRIGKHRHSVYNGHGRNGGVAKFRPIESRRPVHTNLGHTAQSLSAQGGKASPDNLLKIIPAGRKITQVNTDISSLSGHENQQHKADNLAYSGGKRRSRNPHIKNKNEKRIQSNV